MRAQPQFLSDLNIIGTKMLRNELRNFWAGECIDSKHVIFLPPVCPTPSYNNTVNHVQDIHTRVLIGDTTRYLFLQICDY